MGLSHRWLGWLTIFLQSLVCLLLLDALYIGGGDIVVSGCQKIGFYNYCFYNVTAEGCRCISQLKDLSWAGRSSQVGLLLAVVLAYSSLVIVLMGLLTMTFAQCFEERILWKFARVLNVVSLIGLTLGVIIHAFLTWDLFDISQVTPGFLALLAALFGMSLLCCITTNNEHRRQEDKTS